MEIEGNPTCLVPEKLYKLKLHFSEGSFYENILLRGKGVSISNNYDGEISYNLKAGNVLEHVKIIVSYKDSTEKIIDLETFTLDVCQQELNNN
ncbi:MAG: hypothetical protein HYR91_00130 [Flavobacteriia bacterium]|nr:hypothetical protein [Flavobacteriia bacterium]